MDQTNPNQSLRKEEQYCGHIETSLTPRNGSINGAEVSLQEDQIQSRVQKNPHTYKTNVIIENSNFVGHNHSTVSKTSLSSFQRCNEPTNIREEAQEETNKSSSNDLDTLILKAQQNYALSKQVIDQITNSKDQPVSSRCSQNQKMQEQFKSNLISQGQHNQEAKSMLSGRQFTKYDIDHQQIVDEPTDELQGATTHRYHLLSQGHHHIKGSIGLNNQHFSDNETHETQFEPKTQTEDFYSLKPFNYIQDSSLEKESNDITTSKMTQKIYQLKQSCQNSPSTINQQALNQDQQSNFQNQIKVQGLKRHDRNNNCGVKSQGSVGSQIYVQTEGPTSDRQPPDILRDHLINNLGFKPEKVNQMTSNYQQNDQQMNEYNQQIEQLKKLQQKFVNQNYLNINQNSSTDSLGPESLKYHEQVQLNQPSNNIKQNNNEDHQIASAELSVGEQQTDRDTINQQDYRMDGQLKNSHHYDQQLQINDVDSDNTHSFNRMHNALSKNKGYEMQDNGTSSALNHNENSRVDTGHFNSKSALNQNSDMNIINSLNMDPSGQVTHSPRSPYGQYSPSVNNYNEVNNQSVIESKNLNNFEKHNLKSEPKSQQQESIQDHIKCIEQVSQDSSRKDENTETYRVSNDGDQFNEVDHRYHQINQYDKHLDQSASLKMVRMNQQHQQQQNNCNVLIPSDIQSQQDEDIDLQNNNQNDNNQNKAPTVFSMQLQKLYDNIQVVCPKFGIETGEASNGNRIQVSYDLQHHTPFLAIQLYNQVCYLYQQIKELKLASLKQGNQAFHSQGASIENQKSNQLQLEINMLKLQVENLKRESDFYKGQVGMLQEQFKQTVINNQSQPPNIDGFMRELNVLETRNKELQSYIRDLENKNISLNQKNDSMEQRNASLANKLAMQANQEQRNEKQVTGPTQEQYMEFINKKNEHQEKINQMQTEVRDLKQKLQMQQDISKFEKELNVSLKKQVENFQLGTKKDVEQQQKEITRYQDTIAQKNKTIQQLTQQIDEFAQLVALEFPLFNLMSGQKDTKHLQQNSINLSNQNQQPKFVRMTRDTNNDAMFGLLNDFDQALSFTDQMVSFEFETTDNRQQSRRIGPSQNLISAQRGKSANNLSKFNKKKRNSSQTYCQNNNGFEKLFNLPQMIEQQIATAILTDHVLKDHKASIEKKNKRIEEQIEFVNQIEQKMSQFKKQKDDFAENQKALTKDNEELKVKFSQLLDQFQEYVNETEKKAEEDQNIQKEIQEKLLNDLNCTIRELEEMSQNLQRDGEEKDQIINNLEKERDILQKDITYLKERYQQAEDHKDQLQNVKIRSLNEEIKYLKKHYMVEIDLLQQENKNLRIKLRTTNSANRQDDQNLTRHQHKAAASHSPYNRRPLHAPDNYNSFERQINHFKPNDSQNRIFGHNNYNCLDQMDSQETAGLVGKTNNLLDSAEQSKERIHRQSSKNRSNSANQSNYHNLRSKSYDRANQSTDSVTNLHDNLQQQNKQFYNNQKKWHGQLDQMGVGMLGNQTNNLSASKSPNNSRYYNRKAEPNDISDQRHDFTYSRYQQMDQKRGRGHDFGPVNQHSIAQVDQGLPSQHGSLESRNRSGNRQIPAGHSTADDQLLRNNEILLLSAKKENNVLNNLKKELDEKQQLIQFQNQEIVQLRFEFEEFKNKDAQMQQDSVSLNQRSRLLMDIDGVIETLYSELERIKINLWNEQTQYDPEKYKHQNHINITNNVVREIDEEIHSVKSEEKLITMLQSRIKKLNRILSLSSEILLLSTKQKYLPQQYRNTKNSQVEMQQQQTQGFSNAMHESQKQMTPILIQNQNQQLSDVGQGICSNNRQNNIGQPPTEAKYVGIDDQALIDENNSLKRTIYKYENTLAQLDSIFRRDNNKEECIYELKKLTENQLHQILRLQKEVDAAERNKKIDSIDRQKAEDQNNVFKKEISMLRERLAQSEQQNKTKMTEYAGNQHLKFDKIQQLSSEQKLHEKQQQLNEAMSKLKEKETQLDEIRSRITVVAELFEKKPIKQRYSFEVLCDFIHDKAKRLFTKYENALKDKKSSTDEKFAQIQKKNQSLEIELEKAKEIKDLVRMHVIPKLQVLLKKPQNQFQGLDRVSCSLVRELLDELVFQYGKIQQVNQRLNNESVQNQDKVKHLQALLELTPTSRQPVHSPFLNGPATQKIRGQSPPHITSINGSHIATSLDQQKMDDQQPQIEIERMRKEKIEMNQKLEEFAQIMRDFQMNQQKHADENGQIKSQIDKLENKKRSINANQEQF